MENIKCPNCGESYYSEKYSTRTAMYYPAIWKDGVNQNPDGNVSTTYCECINCHYEFSYQTQYGKIFNVTLGKKVTPVETIDWAINDFSKGNMTADTITMNLPTTIRYDQSRAREDEIARLEKEIESLKQQLLEVKANPDWTQRSYI